MGSTLKKAGTFLAITLFLNTVAAASAFADNLDTYRNLITKKTYTIKYENITSEPRQTNRDKVSMYGGNFMDMSKLTMLTYKPLESVIVSNVDKHYEESGANGVVMCRLQRGNDEYVYTRVVEKGSINWFGTKKGEVVSTQTNQLVRLMEGDSFGGATATHLFNAFMPNSSKTSAARTYEKAGEGWLSNGLNYIDYRSTDKGDFEAIRYYFNGNTLVKIASGLYITDKNGNVVDGRRSIIKINEFSPTADPKYFRLPSELKDKSKKKDAQDGGDE